MKDIRLFLIAAIAILLSSCDSYYYQVYQVYKPKNLILKENCLIYEDNNCTISYYLWKNRGNAGFVFYNKTDQNIYLNLGESFFIRNGVAYDYFLNRTWSYEEQSKGTKTNGTSEFISSTISSSAASAISSGLMMASSVFGSSSNSKKKTTSERTISYVEKKIVCIPGKTSCDMLSFPKEEETASLFFPMDKSPLTFSNVLVYAVGESGEPKKIEHNFYVMNISNIPESLFIDKKQKDVCEQQKREQVEFFRDAAPDKFFIKYKKD